jgi:cell division protein FtsB
LGPTASDALAAEKVEAIGLEYSYLLTSQLDSQRAYYEEQISTLRAELSSAHEKISFLESSSPDSASLQLLEERAAKAEAKIQKGLVISRRFEKDLKEERLVSEGLMTTIAALRGKLDEGEKAREQMRAEMDDMKDQLRDVMFYMQARDKIESSASKAGRAEEADGQGKNAIDELLADAAGGSIITSGTSPPVPSASSSLRKKGKKKR